MRMPGTKKAMAWSVALPPAWVTSRTAAQPMTFEGVVNRKPVTLLPIGRVAHEYYTTYFQMM